jgi:predicted transposase YbfD/YdcC
LTPASLLKFSLVTPIFYTIFLVWKEVYYYISSAPLTPENLLKHARLEWAVESMHWLLDVHFGEDRCLAKERNTQFTLNILRKIVLNLVKLYKKEHAPKLPRLT